MDGQRWLLGALFPSDRPQWTRREVTLAALVVVVAFLVPSLRQVGAPVFDTVWAEDGFIFLQDALALSPMTAIPKTYAGYLQLIPRLTAEVTALFPLGYASIVLILASTLLLAAASLAVFVASRSHVRSPWSRTLLAFAVPLAPPGAVEVLNNIANAQWPLLFASFWLILWLPRSHTGVLAASILLVATALSAGLAVLLLPLVVLRLLGGPRGREQLPAWLFTVAIAVPLLFVQSSGLDPGGAHPFRLVTGFLQRVGVVALAGHRVGGAAWRHLGLPWLVLVAVLLAVVLLIGVLGRGSRVRSLVLVAASYSFAFFAVPLVLRDHLAAMLWAPGTSHYSGARYAYVPVLLVYSMGIVALDRRPRWLAPRPWRGARVVAVALFLLAVASDFRASNARASGPLWSDTVTRAESTCSAGEKAAVTVDITPEGWHVDIPCRELVNEGPV